MIARFLLLFDIAAKHLLVRRRQSLVAIGGVTVGVGFFLAVSALMVGSQDDFVKRLIDAAPHIIVSDELRSPPPQPGLRANPGAAVELRGYKVRNEVRGIKDWQRIIRAVDDLDGAIASPSLTGAVTLRLGGREEPLAVIGIDPAIEQRISTIADKLASGRPADLERVQGGVIIGEEMAERLGLRMGDIVAATSAAGTTLFASHRRHHQAGRSGAGRRHDRLYAAARSAKPAGAALRHQPHRHKAGRSR